jgi:ERCC4-type nuclease
VDDRERRSGVPGALANHPNLEVTIRRLKLGDYLIDKTLIVERKTLSDFALSVRDERLFPQVSRLIRSQRERPCLILEGTRKRYRRLAVPRSAFQGALITVTVVFGLPVLRSRDPEETANLILYASDQLQRTTVRPPRRCGFKTTTVRRHQLYLLQAIPEIGGFRAELLLNAFGSPAGVATASVESLRTVDGIGEIAAKRIHDVYHVVAREE